MLIEIRDWREDLQVGDLAYHKGTLLKVTRRRESKDGHTRTVKFRRVGRIRLKEWVPPPPVKLEQPPCGPFHASCNCD